MLMINNKFLRRFWFNFNKSDKLPPGLAWGCGITSFDKEDAIKILKEHVFQNFDYVEPFEIIEDIDVSELDQNHIVPNIGPPSIRGVWFPIGY